MATSPTTETYPMPQDERRLAAITSSYVQGYTALAQKNEAVAIEMLDRYREMIHPVLSIYDGREDYGQ